MASPNDVMLSNVIGTAFNRSVLAQLYMRAARNSSVTRSTDEVLFLANKTAWVKLVSSVNISLPPATAGSTAAQTDLTKFYEALGLENVTTAYPDGTSLAKNWILEAGTSFANGNGIKLRSGLGGEGSYGLGGITEQGYRPMPGLTSVQIDTAGRLGSLRIATINFKVWNMNQLNTVEALYFRLGYSMLLEWGHTQYYTNEGLFISNNIQGIDDPFRPNLRKENVQQEIAKHVKDTDNNYDGMLGIVTNFTWAFNQEGGYDCSIKLVGLGAVMDSMRINQAYKLPTGLITGYYNAKTRIEQLNAEALAKKNAAQNPPPPPPTPPALVEPKNFDELFTLAQADGYVGNKALFLQQTAHYPAISSSVDPAPDYFYQSIAPDASRTNPAQFGLFIQRTGSSKPWDRMVNKVGAEYYINLGTLNRVAVETFRNDFVLGGGIRLDTTAFDIDVATNLTKVGTLWDFVSGQYGGKYLGSLSPNDVAYTDVQKYPFDLYFNYFDTAPSNKSKGIQFRFIAEYNGPSDKNYEPTRKQVIEAFDNFWNSSRKLKLKKEIDQTTRGLEIVGETDKITIKAQRTTPIPKQALAVPTEKDVTITFTITIDDTGLISTIGTPPAVLQQNPPATNTPGTGSAGNTNGATNTTDSDQTDAAFESALVAMLAYVKTVTQANSGGDRVPKPYNLVGATKKFYKDGILQDVDFTPPTNTNFVGPVQPGQARPFTPSPISQSFDVTKYAQKGFNASIMADASLYGSVPPVNFADLCQSWLIRYGQGGDPATEDIASAQVYIKFGYLLAFLNNMCLIYDTTKDVTTAPTSTTTKKHPYLYIDFNPETNFCLTSPQQMSIDPTICLIPFQGSQDDYAAIYDKTIYQAVTNKFNVAKDNFISSRLPKFQVDGLAYQGKIMNILLNVDYLIGLANSFATSDPEHSVNLKRFLETIVVDVNKALGNFNVFRVAYLDESNTVQIRDDQYTPNLNQTTILDREFYKTRSYNSTQVSQYYPQADISNLRYGQLPVFGAQSLVRGFEFKTNLSTKLSSMIAISAQAATGSINAKDPSSLAHLNQNYEDRYKQRIENPSSGPAATATPANKQNKQDKENNDQIAANSFNNHVKSVYGNLALNTEKIEAAKNYYVERSALVKTDNILTSAAPFIPADCEITIDGIGGIIMGQAFTIPESRMPFSLRGEDGFTKVGFIVAGLTHTIENNQWLTKIKGQMIKLRQSSTFGTQAAIANITTQPAAPAVAVAAASIKQANPNIRVTSPSADDIAIYKAILTGIGAPTSDENLKVLYAWRQAEAGSAAWNPFNTTFVKTGTTYNNCNRNANGTLNPVKNYASKQDGIDATVATLKLSYYTKIRNGLISNAGAAVIATYVDEFSTWGTGYGVNTVLAGNTVNPPAIPKTTTQIKTC